MEGNYLLKTKGAIKKIGAISTTLAMLGSTITGALALDLSTDYPSKFTSDLAFVVGSNAAVEDTLGSIDVMGDVQFSAKECVPVAGAVTVSGGVTEDIPLGESLAPARKITNSSVFDQDLQDDDLDHFLDTTITFQSADYDVSEVLLLGQGGNFVSVETSLTSSEDDYESNIFLEIVRDSVKYYYQFDETIQLNSSTTSDPLEIKFLGKTLKITNIDTSSTKFTASVGAEYFMSVGDAVTVDDKKVTLENVGSGGAIVVNVDGVTETIPSGSTETVNGIEIKNDETFYEDNKAQRSATLIIGKDAVETYNDGDAFIGEDEDDPNWIWDLANLNTKSSTTISLVADASTAGPKFGIENDFQMDDDSDNPPTIGECIDLPNNYVSVCLDSLTVADTEYATYNFEYDSSADLSDADTSKTSVKSIFIHTSQSEGIEVRQTQLGAPNVTTGSSKDRKTEKMWLHGINETSLGVYYKEENDNKVHLAGYAELNGTTGNATEVARINFDNTKADDITIIVDGSGNPATSGDTLNITVRPFDSTLLPDYDDNITMVWTFDGNNVTNKLGDTANKEEAGELVWNTVTGIGTKDEDHRSRYGIIIRDPKSNGASDQVKLEIPADQVRANVVIRGATTATSAGGETCTIKQVTPTNLRDTEVTDVTKFNAVFVGGPCADPLVEDVFGVTCSGWPLKTGEAMVKLVANGNKLAMLVAGTEAIDTRRAAKAIRSKAISLSGTEVILTTATDTVTVQS